MAWLNMDSFSPTFKWIVSRSSDPKTVMWVRGFSKRLSYRQRWEKEGSGCFSSLWSLTCVLLFLLVSLVGYVLWLWLFLDSFYTILQCMTLSATEMTEWLKYNHLYQPSKHTTSQQRRYNVAATSWRCSDVVTTLCVCWEHEWSSCIFI